MRFYFDLIDERGTWTDDEGMELATVQRAQEEAIASLAHATRDLAKSDILTGCKMAIHVRDRNGPVLRLKLTLEVERMH